MAQERGRTADQLVQKLVNDADEAQRFEDDRDAVIEEHDLSDDEKTAFKSLNVKELRETTHRLRNLTQARVGSLYVAQ